MTYTRAPGSYKPNQLIVRAHGIRNPHWDGYPVLATSDNGVMMMDAPEWLPAGSTYRREEHFDDGVIWYSAWETLTRRTKLGRNTDQEHE